MNAHFAAGRYAGAMGWARNTVERYPELHWPHALLVAAAAMRRDRITTAEALDARLRLRPDFSLAWMTQNMPFIGEMGERVLEGLRRAAVPEA